MPSVLHSHSYFPSSPVTEKSNVGGVSQSVEYVAQETESIPEAVEQLFHEDLNTQQKFTDRA